MKNFQLISGFVLCAFFWGCYSFSGSTLPPHLNTVRIPPVENRTLQSSLADELTRELISGFRSRGNLTEVNEGGDAELLVTLTNYSHAPEVLGRGDDVSTFRVNIWVNVRFYDNEKDKVLFEENRIPGYGAYTIARGETEETGQRRAVENLVQVILDKTVSGW